MSVDKECAMSRKSGKTVRSMQCICLISILFLLMCAGCGNASESELFIEEEPDIIVVEKKVEAEVIVVEIKGQVLRPGVYTMEQGARLNDLMSISGGPTGSADLKNVNLAMKILDGESFYIPSEDEDAPEVLVSGAGEGTGSKKIDLNAATREELMSVTGIGPSTADNILAYREENGRFNSVEDLLNVNRIGEKTLEKIRPFFMVR